jgi:hypothetical protein
MISVAALVPREMRRSGKSSLERNHMSENYDFLPALDDKRGFIVDAILFTNLL